MIPSNAKIIQCMKFTFESVLMPKIEGDYEKSQALTMLNLFRYARELSEREGPMLWAEKNALMPLLASVATYLDSLPPDAENRALLQQLQAEVPEPPNGYPGMEYLSELSTLLKGRLDAVLGYLVGFPKEKKAEPAYQAVRQAIRQYLIDSIQRDDVLMRAAFTSKRR